MRLHCAELLETLRNKPIIMMGFGGIPDLVRASDATRKRLLAPILPKIHQARKFIFDSGHDELETSMAVRDTAVAMMEEDLFHQPHPIIWIEDPYEDDPDGMRNFYLGIETDGLITVYTFNRTNTERLLRRAEQEMGLSMMDTKGMPSFTFHPYPMEINLREPSDNFQVRGQIAMTPEASQVLQEAIYSYKKLIVTLNASNHIEDRVAAPPRDALLSQRRFYEHSIIRIPVDDTAPSEPSGSGGPSKRRRMHLVRGYVWGKNTKALADQRWIKPYFRGAAELGVVRHEHTVVR